MSLKEQKIRFILMDINIFLHPDYLFNIIPFLDTNSSNNLLLVNKIINSNINLFPLEYQNNRLLWKEMINEFSIFRTYLSNIINSYDVSNKLILLCSFFEWDGPLLGIGIYNNKLCYYGRRKDIVKKRFRFSNYSEFRNYMILDEGEYTNFIDYSYEIKILDNEFFEKAIRILYILIKQGNINNKLFYINKNIIKKQVFIRNNEEILNKYQKFIYNFSERLNKEEFDFSTTNYINLVSY
jgi:hypothetical protein